MTDLKTLKDFEWNEEKPFYKCGHNRQIIILDSNLLSMSSYEIWKDSVGFNGDKSQCWECYCKDEEKIGCGKEMGGHNCGYCKICKEYYLCPSCQKKKDNHSQQTNSVVETEPYRKPYSTESPKEVNSFSADKEPSDESRASVKNDAVSRIDDGSLIPSSKVFEDVIKLIDEFPNPYPPDIFKWNNTEKLGFDRGTFNKFLFKLVENIKEDLKSKIKEKWGKIEI